jgi:hypothetical protein
MPLTPKQEKFAQVWHATGNKSEAYRQAYNAKNMTDAAINDEAYRLSVNPEITLRFAELQKSAQKRNNVTVDTVSQMYLKAWKMAEDIKNPSAMVSAASGMAKLHGLNAPDKQHVDHSSTDGTMRPTTIELVPYVNSED